MRKPNTKTKRATKTEPLDEYKAFKRGYYFGFKDGEERARRESSPLASGPERSTTSEPMDEERPTFRKNLRAALLSVDKSISLCRQERAALDERCAKFDSEIAKLTQKRCELQQELLAMAPR